MNTFARIIEILFVLLILAGIVTIIKYPKDILVRLPLGILKIFGDRLIGYIKILTLPVWGPVYLLDNHFNWGIISSKEKLKRKNVELPDIQYDTKSKLEVDFDRFDKYLITSAKNGFKIREAIAEGLRTINGKHDSLELLKSNEFYVARISGIDLYSFHYLVQWMQNEIKSSRNFGFAQTEGFSFFCTCDKDTLNNMLGKTSARDIYSFSLSSTQGEYLSINNSIGFRAKYTTNFFNQLLKKIPAGNTKT